ncbi:AAA family ATPase [Aquipuribacter sp. SD81]|uniref:AAA family ATPase n=1 Tax=Aquipuribacter sp. SD81 TaxID=3127703 RepID=UPI0030180CB3
MRRPTIEQLAADLGATDPVPTDDGLRALCPACMTGAALTITTPVPGTGATLSCASGCHLGDIAEARGLTQARLDAFLESATTRDAPAAASNLAAGLLDRHDLSSLPAAEPLIADTLDRRTVAFLAGAPGSYKTFTALAWACSIATGTAWLGRQAEPGKVLYVAAEGTGGLDARVTAWERHNGMTVPAGKLTVFPDALPLADPEVLEGVCRLAAAEDYDLVVVDTLARAAHGLVEESSKDMGLLMDAAHRVRRATTRGTVLFLHHSSKSGATLRGSSALEGASDTVWTSTRKGRGVLLRCVRAKDRDFDADVFDLAPNASGDSIVLALRDDTEQDKTPGGLREETLTVWRDLDQTFGAARQTFSRSEAFRAVREAARDDATGLSDATLRRRLNDLLELGTVVRVAAPSGSRADRFTLARDTAERHGLPLHNVMRDDGDTFLDAVTAPAA